MCVECSQNHSHSLSSRQPPRCKYKCFTGYSSKSSGQMGHQQHSWWQGSCCSLRKLSNNITCLPCITTVATALHSISCMRVMLAAYIKTLPASVSAAPWSDQATSFGANATCMCASLEDASLSAHTSLNTHNITMLRSR